MIENKASNQAHDVSDLPSPVEITPPGTTTDTNSGKVTNCSPSEETASKPNSNDLIQLEPKKQKPMFDLKNFGGFTFPPSRFRITRIFESTSVSESSAELDSTDTPATIETTKTSSNELSPEEMDDLLSCEDSSDSSMIGEGLLVDSDSSTTGEGLLVDIDSETNTSMNITSEMDNLDLIDVLDSDSSSSQDADWENRVHDNYACGSRDSVDSMGTPIARLEKAPDSSKENPYAICSFINQLTILFIFPSIRPLI